VTAPFRAALAERRGAGRVPVIPDVKLRSPKEGDLLAGRDPVEQAARLAAAGAPVLSVVTEAKHFGGSLRLLRDIAGVGVPVLRKDFITEPDELERSAEAGAAAVLLICATTGLERTAALAEAAIRLGLEPLVEAHTAAELTWAARLAHETTGVRLVGLNNRDIKGYERDAGTVEHTAALARRAALPPGALLVSESGIAGADDVAAAARAGADAVLVGTAIWRAPDPAACYSELAATRARSR
jgi:indole-3-glycerol phosphate synthase